MTALRTRPAPLQGPPASVLADVREGLAYVRSEAWLWATLVIACITLLAFWGPVEVLLPYVIRNELGRPASDFGLVLAAGGLGGILGAVFMSRRGIPGQKLRFLYAAWGLSQLPIAGYALATATWQLALLAAAFGYAISLGMIVWSTLMQTRVPPAMLGRVTSLDWLVSIGLTPVSFALTGPIAAAAGTDATLIGAGALGAVPVVVLYALVADLRRDETLHEPREVLDEAGVADLGGLHAHDLDPVAGR